MGSMTPIVPSKPYKISSLYANLLGRRQANNTQVPTANMRAQPTLKVTALTELTKVAQQPQLPQHHFYPQQPPFPHHSREVMQEASEFLVDTSLFPCMENGASEQSELTPRLPSSEECVSSDIILRKSDPRLDFSTQTKVN